MASRVTKTPQMQGAQRSTTPVRSAAVESPKRSPTHDEIRLRAYYKWEAAGRPGVDPLLFWLEAEQELRK